MPIIAEFSTHRYNATDPLRLWVIQVGECKLRDRRWVSPPDQSYLVIIIGVVQILAMLFGRLRQPRVIAEVVVRFFHSIKLF
jgi:hypothetical protein